jgi:hypothetical protein
MGRFAQLLGGGSFSTSPRTTLKPGTRFKSLNRESVAAFDKELLASIMGVKPTTPDRVSLPSTALKLNISSPVAGQNWRMKPQGEKPIAPIPMMQDVRVADMRIPAPVIKPPVAPAKALSLSSTSPVGGQSWRTNPMGLAEGEVRTLKDVGRASHDAFDLWEAQGTRGVNGLLYMVNDWLVRTDAPGTKAEENKKYAALMMDLAGQKAQAITDKATGEGVWYESVVTMVNGGLSLLQSVAMGMASQGGQVLGQAVAQIGKNATGIAVGQVARQYGLKQAVQAVRTALSNAAGKVGLSAAASTLPAWVSSAVEGGAIYRELTDQGKSPLRATAAALVSIAGTAISESIALERMYSVWMKNVHSALAARFVNALGNATVETVQELGQNLWQNGVRMAIGQDDTQKLATIEEAIDTIIGIFPSAFLFSAGTFSSAGFKQMYSEEAQTIIEKIMRTFVVDQKTAEAMYDTAITKFGPAVRDMFLGGFDTKQVKLSSVLQFMKTSDPYVGWLVQVANQPMPAGKQTTAATTEFAVTPTTDRSLNRYLGQQASPTQRQQTAATQTDGGCPSRDATNRVAR